MAAAHLVFLRTAALCVCHVVELIYLYTGRHPQQHLQSVAKSLFHNHPCVAGHGRRMLELIVTVVVGVCLCHSLVAHVCINPRWSKTLADCVSSRMSCHRMPGVKHLPPLTLCAIELLQLVASTCCSGSTSQAALTMSAWTTYWGANVKANTEVSCGNAR